MKRATKIQVDYQDEVDAAIARFADHEDMSEGRVLNWLAQFAEADLPVALRVIEKTRYVNATNIRGMTRQLFDLVEDELTRQGHKKTAFVAVGDPGAGSGVVIRALRDLLRNTKHRLLSMVDLSRVSPKELDALVFVDDFSGTGKTLEKWWANVESLVRPIDAAVYVGLLVLNEPARKTIERFAEIVSVDELDKKKNVLSEECRDFSTAQKAVLRKYCRDICKDGDYVFGFGGCGLLLAFRHGCPNNVLPLLWMGQKKGWKSLFNRRAI